jgi:hypothetical protein
MSTVNKTSPFCANVEATFLITVASPVKLFQNGISLAPVPFNP